MAHLSRRTVNRPTGFPVFYTILLSFVAVFAVLLVFVCGNIRERLADYEQSLPKYEAKKIFEEYYDTANDEAFRKLIRKADSKLSEFESTDMLMEYIKDEISGSKLTYSEVSTGLSDDKIKYVVKTDGDSKIKISSFTLSQNGKKSKFGNPLYSLESIELLFKAQTGVTVSAPSDYTVYINDIACGEKDITEAGIKTESCSHMPEGTEGITYTSYKAENLLRQPEIKVVSPDGKEAAVTEKSGIYTAELLYNDALAAEMSDYVIEAAKKYAAYMQSDGSFYNFSKYLEQGTELYEATRTTATYFTMPHTGYSFENESASEFYAYDENTFSCRVKMVHLLHKSGAEDYRDYIDVTWYFRMTDGQYLIYDRTNN